MHTDRGGVVGRVWGQVGGRGVMGLGIEGQMRERRVGGKGVKRQMTERGDGGGEHGGGGERV